MDLLNKVMVIGNLTRDPEVRETGSGKTVAELSIAVAQRGGGGGSDRDGTGATPAPEPVFLQVVFWERQAENASQYLRKGSPVLVEGRLRMNRWEDRETGQARSRLTVTGERLRFLNFGPGRDSRNETADHGADHGAGDDEPPPPTRQPRRAATPAD